MCHHTVPETSKYHRKQASNIKFKTMKITGYKLDKYIEQLDRAIGDANYPKGDDLMGMSILRIETDEGITGMAPGGNDAIESLFHLIEGRDPRGVVGLWKEMVDWVHKGNNEGAVNAAISAIDVALWDLKAKINDEPLWQTLGAMEGRAKAYASDIGYNLSDDELHAFYSRMADMGIDGGKIKIGLNMKDDLRRIGIMNDALRKVKNRPYLMIDTNEYWSPKQAIRYISQIEKHFDIFWAEEPARRWDYDGLRQVSRGISAAVASGENLNDVGQMYPLISQQAIDVANVGVGHSGITGARQVANMCYAYELPVTMMNCPANFMVHLAAALPNHNMMEVVDPGREDAFKSWDNHIEDGWIVIGNTPGLGIILDDNKISALQSIELNRKPGFPFPRREGAGLWIKDIEPGEVSWK
ncbi:MAG: mandelate racemase/muconate lactonizing enzyme family protein [Dehalococcoidia bacterium]|jgi:L-alanine-DL-glutamate epimerase-like enolase superfamily enzyme|nr:mandelate racemase/muconate lactonizing enzyme family protein [Dehalococcoidia bacterium]